MAEYKKLSDLSDIVVKLNDRVILCDDLCLYVKENGLFSLDSDGDKIFKKLLIFNKEKFFEKSYGYKPKGYHFFPCSEEEDYEAITRSIRALMERNENPPIDLKFYRWRKKRSKKKES